MARARSGIRKWTIADFVDAMESIAPTRLAQAWDNVGLLAGDPSAALRRVLLCIDLTAAVVQEAVKSRTDLVMAYHPPIFKPTASLRADAPGSEAAVFRCIARGVAVYSTHTALDAADGGTNDVIASLCGISETEPLEYVSDPSVGRGGGKDGPAQYKLVVFVPPRDVDEVAEAMFRAGAGQIGDYSNCSFRLEGLGTFLGGESTNPTVGEKGRMEYVEEVRLETVVPARRLACVVRAMIDVHPYEEPAFDIYPLTPRPVRGIGRVGRLPASVQLGALARKLRRATPATQVSIVGEADQVVERAVIVVGSAGSLPFRLGLTPRDVVITGEIRHHDALAMRRIGCAAVALGHWASERPVLTPLARRLTERLPSVAITVSAADADPFRMP